MTSHQPSTTAKLLRPPSGSSYSKVSKNAAEETQQYLMDEDADDQDAQVPMTPEEELLDYQRRIKNMENEKKIFAEEAQAQLKRHKALIEKLQKDNEAMKDELSGSINGGNNSNNQGAKSGTASSINLTSKSASAAAMVISTTMLQKS